MVICCIGDSLTEGDYGIKGKTGIANVREKGYPYFLAQLTKAEVRNFGKCGWRSSDMLKYYREGGLDLSGADKIIVMLGTNGGQDPDGDSPDNAAYIELVNAVRAEQSQARVYLCTPPHVTENPAYSNCGYAKIVDDAQRFVRKICPQLGATLIDIGASKRITRDTEDELQANDGLHFVEAGYRVLAREIADGIAE